MTYRPRVLVIDDDPAFRSTIVAMLRRSCLVAVASDGSQGFYKALEHPPDLIILDVRMPKWDGLQTLRAIRNHATLADVKVVMLTAVARRDTVLAAIQAGANDYILKSSFNHRDFLEKLQRLLPFASLTEQKKERAVPSAIRRDPAIGRETHDPSRKAGPAPDEPDQRALQQLIDDW